MKVKLGELVKIRTGKLDANAASENGEYPFFTCSKEPLRISTYSYDCECILVAGNGDLNVKYYNGKFDAYQRTYIIESNGDERLYLPYLYYFMTLYIPELRKISIGGVIKYIKLGNLTDMEISLPDIEEQKVACKKLEKIKNITDKKESQLSCLDDIIKARFVEMFGSTNNEQVKIAELVEQKISTAKKDFEGDAEIKYIDISSINNRRNTMTGFTKYKMSNAPSRARQHVQFGDIIISTVRPNLKNVAMVSMDSDNLVASSGFCVLRPKKCTSEFLMAIVCSDRFTDAMVNVVTGANYPAIKNSDVLNYCVPLPSEEQQRQFANFVTQVDKSKFALSNELAMGNFYIRLIHDCIMHGCINL